MLRYIAGSDAPELRLTFQNGDGTYPDFTTGYSFELKIAAFGSTTALVNKTTGLTGAAGSATAPNLIVTWATTNELNTLTPGFYVLQATAKRTSDNAEWHEQWDLEIRPKVT